jgi:hypothetical protein
MFRLSSWHFDPKRSSATSPRSRPAPEVATNLAYRHPMQVGHGNRRSTVGWALDRTVAVRVDYG